MPPTLEIGVDGTCLASNRGYGRFLRELLPELLRLDSGHRYSLILDRRGAETNPFPSLRTVVVDTAATQASAASARGNRGVVDLMRMGRAAAGAGFDVMFFPSVYSYFPLPSRVPVAVAFHDTIADAHGRVVFPSRRTRWLWNAKVRLALWQARTIMTVSEWSRRRLQQRFGLSAEAIRVVAEAPAPAFRPVEDGATREQWLAAQGLTPGDPYFLYVGGFNPHKNLVRLVDAFARSLRDSSSARLLLVGDYAADVFHADVGALRAAVHTHRLDDRVAFGGFVADEMLRHLYAGAMAVVLPSLEEGFGLPAIEGAACGTPCIATTQSPLPELLHGGGLFVDPTDIGTLAQALRTLHDSTALRTSLGRAALERAGRLSWRSAAEAACAALEATARR